MDREGQTSGSWSLGAPRDYEGEVRKRREQYASLRRGVETLLSLDENGVEAQEMDPLILRRIEALEEVEKMRREMECLMDEVSELRQENAKLKQELEGARKENSLLAEMILLK